MTKIRSTFWTCTSICLGYHFSVVSRIDDRRKAAVQLCNTFPLRIRKASHCSIQFSIRSCGSMAFPRPTQLSRCLQQILPAVSRTPASALVVRSISRIRNFSALTPTHRSSVTRSLPKSPFGGRSASTFSSSSSGHGPGSGSTRSQLLKPTSIVLIFVPILCGILGVWQVKRLRWKVALIDEVDRNLHKDPLVLPANIKYVLVMYPGRPTTEGFGTVIGAGACR